MKTKIRKSTMCFVLIICLLLTPLCQTTSYASSRKRPVITVTAKATGIYIKWKKCSHTKRYYIYRSTNGSRYRYIGSTKKSHYYDHKIISGKKCKYKVKTSRGYISKAKSIRYLKRPILKAKSVSSGIQLSWKKIKGAKYYKIYYHSKGKWKFLKKIRKRSYTDKSVSSSKSRTYKIKAIRGKNSSCLSKALKCKYKTKKKTVHTHTYTETQVKAPSCTENGLIEYSCKCGKKYRKSVQALGHEISDYETINEPTCTETGLKVAVCSRCGDQIEEVIPATGHSYDEGNVIKEATCTEKGIIRYICTECGDIKEEMIPLTDHTKRNPVTENEISATCTEDGSYDTVYYCSVCNKELERTTTIVPATGHKYSSTVILKEAACTEEGLEQEECSVCHSIKTASIPKTKHIWTDITEDIEIPDSETGSTGFYGYVLNENCTYIICQQCRTRFYLKDYDSEEAWMNALFEHIGPANPECTSYIIYRNNYGGCDYSYHAYDTKTETHTVKQICSVCGEVKEHEHKWVDTTVDKWVTDDTFGNDRTYDETIISYDYWNVCNKCGYISHECNFATEDEWLTDINEHILDKGGSYSLKRKPNYERIGRLNEGHYKTEVISKHCSICGLEETENSN